MPRPEALFLHGAAMGVMAYGFLDLKTMPMSAEITTQTGGFSQFLTIQGWVLPSAHLLTRETDVRLCSGWQPLG